MNTIVLLAILVLAATLIVGLVQTRRYSRDHVAYVFLDLSASVTYSPPLLAVPTLAVWRGNTATCGLSICRAPDGMEPVDGELIELDGTSRVKMMTGKATPEPSYAESDEQIHEKRVLRRAGRLPAVKVVARRNVIQEMYNTNLHPLDIALALDLPLYTVNNDLGWLSRHGKIQRNRHRQRRIS